MNEQTFTLSNPRKEDVIPDWPLGSGRTGDATFTHESNNRGERIRRVTPNRQGVPCKPKRSTYYVKIRLVDGSDGKTHMIGLTRYSGMLCVMSCDMKLSDFAVFEADENYTKYLAFFD